MNFTNSEQKIGKQIIRIKDVGKDVFSLIEKQGNITIPQISKILNITERTVERHIFKLKLQKKVLRIGGKKNGHWQVIDTLPAPHETS